MVFTGTYSHQVDGKGRVAIPAAIRTRLKKETKGKKAALSLYVVVGEGRVLCLYTEEGFEKRAEELDRSEMEGVRLLKYERVMFSLAEQVEMDDQGRIRLPDPLVKKANLGSDVVIIGVKDHLEVRNRTEWQSELDKILVDEPEILMNPRLAMRKPTGPMRTEAGSAGRDVQG